MITDEDLDKLGARPLTAWDRVKAVGIAAAYPLIFLFQLAKYFVPSHPQYDFHWRQKAMLASIRSAITFQGEKRIGWAAGHATSTNDRVRDFATKHKDIKHREVSVSINPAVAADNPATGSAMPQPTLHFLSGPWITGEADSDRGNTGPVIFYSHGGGYLDPIIPGAHIPLAQSMAKACGAREVVFISYALCPDVQYPAQLVQIVESMRFLLEKEAIPPEDLILAGDSAGAHMMASLMAHMVEPAPYVPPLAPALRGGQLRAAVLLSPWFTWTDAASIGTNPCDYLEGPHAAHLVGVLRPKVEDVWCEIVAAPGAREVWARVFATSGGSGDERPLVKRMLVTASDSEIMYRDARVFAVEYAGAVSVLVGAGEAETQLATVRTEPRVFAVGRRETHVQAGLDEAVKYYGGGTWRALQVFMSSLQD
ncbi:Alpha/beta hydrolase fold-3 [Akanthomyces lecanii RCEF 1005]|uniref:Alpha/beta hydrolase fold-3 n=1 Tax=Akanthomyces lecanii RCEF 1005 TaxID=1081108 RepID=A0A162KTX4_CORDF|nr:Alpha/beta hydrolase fold-3 [Akanthomyces lecanii RCEF 1005]